MKNTIFLFFFLSFFAKTYAQIDTEFWFTAPYVYCPTSATKGVYFAIVSYDEKAKVTISQPANPDFSDIVIELEANDYHQERFAMTSSGKGWLNSTIENDVFNSIEKKGIYITSTAPVSIYYAIDGNESEIYSLKGGNALGNYFVVPMQYVEKENNTNAYSSVEIAATEDNTTVTITPYKALFGGKPANVSFDVTLNKGETYAIRAANNTSGSQIRNTVIRSNNPIVVNSSDCFVNYSGGANDPIGDQLVPVKLAGYQYVAVMGAEEYRRMYFFHIEESGETKIYANGALLTTLTSTNREYTYTLPANTGVYYTSENEKPFVAFQVVGILTGNGIELGGTMLPDMGCTGSRKVVYKPMGNSRVGTTLITKTEYVGDFNGGVFIQASEFHEIPNTEWSYGIFNLPTIGNPMPIENFAGVFHMSVKDNWNAKNLTFGYFSNYNAQPIGAVSGKEYYISGQTLEINIPNLSDLSNITLTLPDGTSHTYDNTSGTLTNPIYTQPNIQPEHQGSYTIDAERVNNCPVEPETLHLSIYTPSVAQSDTMCLGDQYQLTAPGYGPYTWTPTTPQNQNQNQNQKYNTITPTQGDTTYTHTVLSTQPGINLAANPHFSQGNTSFSTDYTYNTLSLTTPGQYTIGKNPLSYNPLYTNTPDHTQDTAANQLIINCSSGESTLWSQTINNLKSGQHYEFSAWYTNITPHATPVNIKYKENGLYTYQHDNDGNLITDPITGNPIEEEPFILPADNQWHQHTYAFKAQGTSITLNIEAVNTQSGSSLSIDDIRLSPLYALTDTFHIHVRDSLKPQLQTPPYICQGIAHIELTETYNTYTWSTGETTPSITLTQAGDYHVRVTEGQDGCARGTLFFTVQPTPPLNITTNPLPEICSGQNHFDLPYTITQGTPGTYSLTYDETAKAAGFQDIEKAPIATPNIQISLPANTQAGNYNLHLTIYESGCDGQGTITPSPQIPFTVQYNPDQTLTQRWNDILSVKNQQYNNGTDEGYQFTSYQWYKNGEKLQDQTHSYLYEPHKFQSGDTYSVKLGRSDGSEIHTCDFTPQIYPDDSNLLQPVESLITPNSPITISGLASGQTITARLWDLHGRVINTRHLDTSASPCTISSPSRSGIYILELTDTRTEEQSFFKVLVK